MRFTGKDSAGANADLLVDEIVMLPWRPTNNMAVAWTGQSTLFSPLPRLNVTGDIGIHTVRGVLGPSTYEEVTSNEYLNVDFSLWKTRGA